MGVMEALAVNTSTALNQMLEPLSKTLSIEAAEAITALKVSPALDARIQDLAVRSNEGLLTEQEQAEYRSYVLGAEVLALLKLKARRVIENGAD